MGCVSPGKAPWDKRPGPDNSEGGAGGNHLVGAYMFKEEIDRSRSNKYAIDKVNTGGKHRTHMITATGGEGQQARKAR